MSDRSDGWEKRIKENMRPLNVHGSKSIYELENGFATIIVQPDEDLKQRAKRLKKSLPVRHDPPC